MKRRNAICNAICIVVDGLRASALGTYGNTSQATPHLDHLASRSVVAEWLLADSLSGELFYRSLWQGTHALRPESSPPQTSATELLSDLGVEQILLTDEPWLAQHAAELSIDQIHVVKPTPESSAANVGETALGRLLAEVVSQLADWNCHEPEAECSGRMLWVHARGLFGPWDAPLPLRQAMQEEGDPPPAEYLWPPERLADADDPDELLVHRSAYAAQIAVLEECIGALLAQLEESQQSEPTLVMLLGMRGFGLGEHGELGARGEWLYGEQTHVPWLLHLPAGKNSCDRLGGLWQPADVGATLLDWLGANRKASACDGRSIASALAGKSCKEKQVALSIRTSGEKMLRTPAWVLHTSSAESDTESPPPAAQLHVKPDDRWEANDVAVRCPQEVEELTALLERLCQQSRTEQPLEGH